MPLWLKIPRAKGKLRAPLFHGTTSLTASIIGTPKEVIQNKDRFVHILLYILYIYYIYIVYIYIYIYVYIYIYISYCIYNLLHPFTVLGF